MIFVVDVDTMWICLAVAIRSDLIKDPSVFMLRLNSCAARLWPPIAFLCVCLSVFTFGYTSQIDLIH